MALSSDAVKEVYARRCWNAARLVRFSNEAREARTPNRSFRKSFRSFWS
jgi:hypothetical protein